jgi:hypothetical protein
MLSCSFSVNCASIWFVTKRRRMTLKGVAKGANKTDDPPLFNYYPADMGKVYRFSLDDNA